MRHLLACLAIIAAFNVTAQVDGFQLPYNPDVEPDGYIGVADILELLVMFGSEFSPNNVQLSSDSSSLAIEVSSNSTWFECVSHCQTLDGSWRVMTESDIGRNWGLMVDNDWYWVEYPDAYPNSPFLKSAVQKNYGNYLASAQVYENHRCICITHERPKVEYSYCTGGTPNESGLNQCISSKLADGWYPLSGFPNHHDKQGYAAGSGAVNSNFSQYTHASFWRWAD